MLLLFVARTVAVVDRIEGPYAILEWRDAGLTEVPVSVLPPGIREGDRLLVASRAVPPSSVARLRGRRARGAASPPAGSAEATPGTLPDLPGE